MLYIVSILFKGVILTFGGKADSSELFINSVLEILNLKDRPYILRKVDSVDPLFDYLTVEERKQAINLNAFEFEGDDFTGFITERLDEKSQ